MTAIDRAASYGAAHTQPPPGFPGREICILHTSSHRKIRTVIAAAHNPAATIAAPRAGKMVQKPFFFIQPPYIGQSNAGLSGCLPIDPNLS
jgi:hypothetical protein